MNHPMPTTGWPEVNNSVAEVSSSGKVRLALVTNEPAPYRVVPYNIVSRNPDIISKVFYCTEREPTRTWDLPPMMYDRVYLDGFHFGSEYSPIHTNIGIWKELRAFKPTVILTTGYNPTHLLAYIYSRLNKIPHVAMTDGTLSSEASLSRLHRLVRSNVYSHSAAFIGACDGSLQLFRSYGVRDASCFKSPLCANNESFFDNQVVEKQFDFIFSGRFSARKNPLFALDVVAGASRLLGKRASIAFIGNGELESAVRERAMEMGIDAHILGFARQSELPLRYASARIFLFPTLWDPWGVVANEACAAGLPCIVSPAAGVAGELVVHGLNGYVLPLDAGEWAKAAAALLYDRELYLEQSAAARARVRLYSYESAAGGIIKAVKFAVKEK